MPTVCADHDQVGPPRFGLSHQRISDVILKRLHLQAHGFSFNAGFASLGRRFLKHPITGLSDGVFKLNQLLR